MASLAGQVMFVLLGAAALSAQTESPVVGVGPFLHIVSDLDQSLTFYHDVLGLELSGPAGAEHKFTDNPAVANLYGVPGKQFRAAVLKIPGSAMGIELVQWGEAQKPIAGPDRISLVLHGGYPRMGAAPLHDPDGFPVKAEISDIAFAELNIPVKDVQVSMALYKEVLGFKVEGDWLIVPGSSLRIRFIKTTDAGGLNAPFPEPGRGMLRLQVHNIAALAESLKSAGFSVITTGGVPVTLPQGPQVIIVRDPNNFYLQPMETR
jgi:catechol 2,3-dioxygenase-like lactoylglutathione lyase family enzyme